ncbi:hypothetical protein [Tautonia marina]|uniref:hypothetical protein n=1 Tax=Tautonia marina TaxID=2653855 RepID=UPI0013759F7B|nr:hypothetical protein [Tautonia marina]
MSGTFRTHERRESDPNAEPQRLVLYLPIDALDLAERQASQARVETVQRYCESLLLQALGTTNGQCPDSKQSSSLEVRPGKSRTVTDDPDYLAEWIATILADFDAPQVLTDPGLTDPSLARPSIAPEPSEIIVERPAVEVVLRHAGLRGSDPDAFLISLRHDGRLAPGVGPELIQALVELEAEFRNAIVLDRLLCFALHKLAFEGQILVTEGTRNAEMEVSVVELLRLVQEGVDRILSGQNIRYFSSHDRDASIYG